MAKLTFKVGSIPHRLYQIFSNGGSLTVDEAYDLKPKRIRALSQRIADLKEKYEEAGATSPLMFIEEKNKDGRGTHSRYFFKGAGSPYEKYSTAKMY